MKTVTIGFVPRERLSHAAASLQTIIENTTIPFNLIVINNDTPKVFWDPVERLLGKVENVKVIETEHLVSSNYARNLVIEASGDEFICFIENDVEVENGWLARLINACEEHEADVAVPLILEPLASTNIVHFDSRLGHLVEVQGENGIERRIVPRKIHNEKDRNGTARVVEFIESHCILSRRSIFEKIGLFDEKQDVTRNCVDFSMTLLTADIKVIFEPKSVVTFYPPPPVHPEEKEYFLFSWDLETAQENEKTILERWNLVDIPSVLDFAEERLGIPVETDLDRQKNPHLERLKIAMEKRQNTLQEAAKALMEYIPAGGSLILVDDMQWKKDEIAPGLRVLPFLEKDGEYWGNPENDDVAIHELQRMRGEGEKYIAFGKPAFWWLDHYTKFIQFLRSNFKTLLENDGIVIFDLQK